MLLGKKLFEDDFHDWKIMPLFWIGKHLGKNLNFIRILIQAMTSFQKQDIS